MVLNDQVGHVFYGQKEKELQFQSKRWPKSDQQGVKSDQLIKISKNLTKLVKNDQVGLKWPSWSWMTKLVMNDQVGHEWPTWSKSVKSVGTPPQSRALQTIPAYMYCASSIGRAIYLYVQYL